MEKPQYHLIVCNSFRVGGSSQGACNKKGSPDLLSYLQEEINDRGLDAMVTSAGCMNICEKGPVMVVYPQGWWYGEVDEDKLDSILDAMEEDCPSEALLLS